MRYKILLTAWFFSLMAATAAAQQSDSVRDAAREALKASREKKREPTPEDIEAFKKMLKELTRADIEALKKLALMESNGGSKKTEELKWARGVAEDFLLALQSEEHLQARLLMSLEFLNQENGLADSDKLSNRLRAARFLPLIGTKFLKEEMSPDQDEAVFRGEFLGQARGDSGKKVVVDFSLRVQKEKETGKWRVSFLFWSNARPAAGNSNADADVNKLLKEELEKLRKLNADLLAQARAAQEEAEKARAVEALARAEAERRLNEARAELAKIKGSMEPVQLFGRISQVDGDKVTVQKFASQKKGAEKVGVPIALSARGAKVFLAKFDLETKKFVDGDEVDGGLKNEIFVNIPDNGLAAALIVEGDRITKIVVFRGNKMQVLNKLVIASDPRLE